MRHTLAVVLAPYMCRIPLLPVYYMHRGAEADLSACNQLLAYGSTQCTHGMDAGIVCSNTTLGPQYSDTAQCASPGMLRRGGAAVRTWDS